MSIDVVLPNDIDDPARPSGGNYYDRRLIRELTSIGWTVREHAVAGDWPRPDKAARARLGTTLAAIDDGSLVLVDGLIASGVPEVLAPQADRLRLILLVHMPMDNEQEAAALSSAVAVVTTSRWTRGRLLTRYGLDPRRVTVAAPGVDMQRVTAATPGGGRLLCVAAVTHHKGHDVLATALGAVADLPWTCSCAGSLDREPAFVDLVRQVLARCGVADQVAFPGPLSRAELAARYAETDLLVLPSRTESYGMAVTEALAHGVPVLAADVGGVREALGWTAPPGAPGHAVPGLLVPPEDPPALAGALRRWLSDSELRARLRAAASGRRTTLPRWTGTAAVVAETLAAVATGSAVHSGH
jgi:glycosyltransferase involved in cell wall biosynthesis